MNHCTMWGLTALTLLVPPGLASAAGPVPAAEVRAPGVQVFIVASPDQVPGQLVAPAGMGATPAMPANVQPIQPVADLKPAPGPIAPAIASPGCAPQVPCAGCCEPTCCCEPHGRVLAGAGLYLIQPYFETNPSYTLFVQDTGPGTHVDISHHMDLAPLVWLGYMGEDGLGFRARWWYFRQGTRQDVQLPAPSDPKLTVLTAGPLGAVVIRDNAEELSVTSKLQVQVLDLEAVQDTRLCTWDFLFCAGLRLVDITQNYNAYILGGEIPPPDNGLAQNGLAQGEPVRPLLSGSSFTGVGPVIAIEARRSLGDWGLNLYGSARSAILFGSAKQNAFGGDQLNGAPTNHQDQVVAIEELEVGLEYARNVGPSRLFGQIALVGQEWIGAGNASRTAQSGPPTTIPNFSTLEASNFGFFGLAFRLGMNY